MDWISTKYQCVCRNFQTHSTNITLAIIYQILPKTEPVGFLTKYASSTMAITAPLIPGYELSNIQGGHLCMGNPLLISTAPSFPLHSPIYTRTITPTRRQEGKINSLDD